MRILGLDPGFASFGWCLCTYDGKALTVDAMGVIRTQKAAKRLAADDNIRRAKEIWNALSALVAKESGEITVDLLAAEAMSYPPSASTAAKISLAFGAVAAILGATNLPFVQFSPGHIKLAAAGTKKASKADIAKALEATFPGTEKHLGDIPPSLHEHAWDALGAAVASLDTEVVKMAARVLQ